MQQTEKANNNRIIIIICKQSLFQSKLAFLIETISFLAANKNSFGSFRGKVSEFSS